jgi:energy-coupling factor transport system permease protein
LFLSTLPTIAAAKVWREWVSVIKYALFLCLAIVVINALVSYHGATILWQASFTLPVLGNPTITLEAIFFGIGMSLRLLAIISAFAVLTFTIHPDDIMLAIIKLRLPYKSVLVTSLSTRFMPTLAEDVQRISDVQRSRGLEFDRGGLMQRIRNRTAIIIPLLSNSLDRTVQVAEAMESRAFGSGQKRSFFREITLDRLDATVLILGFLPIVLGIIMTCWEMGVYQYYPALERISFDTFESCLLALLVFLINLMVIFALLPRGIGLDQDK